MRVWIVLALAVGCAGYRKPPDPQRFGAVNAPMDHFRSSNGLNVVVYPDPNAATVRVDVRYESGAAQDPAGKEGLAHLVEHLSFTTRMVPDGGQTIRSELTRVASQWNGTTSLDWTQYTASVQAEQLGELLALEARRLDAGCSTLDQDALAREREVVLNELRNQLGDPVGRIPQLLHRGMYGAGHPYHRTSIGRRATVSKLRLDDVCRFMNRHYRAANAVIVVTGPVTLAEVRSATDTAFADFEPAPKLAKSAVPLAVPGGGRIASYQLDVDEPTLFVGWPMPPQGTAAHDLAHFAFGPLADRVARFASTYEWGHDVDTFEIGGGYAPVLVLSVRLRDVGKFDEALQAVKKARKWVGRELGPARDLDHDDSSWRRRLDRRREALVSQYADFHMRHSAAARQLQYRGQVMLLADRLAEVESFKPRGARAAADKMLSMKNASVVFIRPRPGKGGQVRRGFVYSAQAHASLPTPLAADVAEADRDLRLPRLPKARKVVDFRMGNGLRVLLWPRSWIPLVRAQLRVIAGHAREPRGRSGLAGLIGGIATNDHNVFGSHTVSARVDESVRSLSRRLRWQRTELSSASRDLAKRHLRLARTAERLRYARGLSVALYGQGHPYASGYLSPETLKKIDGDVITAWERRHIVPTNSSLIVTGRFDPDLVRKHIVYNFAHISGGRTAKALPRPAPPRRTGPVVITGESHNARAIEVDIHYLGTAGVDSSYGARLVLAQVLELKLRDLRDRLAISHGFSVSYEPQAAAGDWHIQGLADAARSDEAIAAVQKVLHTLRTQPDSYASEFVLARRQVVNSLLTASTNDVAALSQLAFIARFDLPLSYFNSVVSKVAKLRPRDLASLLDWEFKPAQQVLGLYGTRRSVTRALQAIRR